MENFSLKNLIHFSKEKDNFSIKKKIFLKNKNLEEKIEFYKKKIHIIINMTDLYIDTLEVKELIANHVKIAQAIDQYDIKSIKKYRKKLPLLYTYIPYAAEYNEKSFRYFIKIYPIVRHEKEYMLSVESLIVSGKYQLLDELNQEFKLFDRLRSNIKFYKIIKLIKNKILLISFLLSHDFSEKFITSLIFNSINVIDPETISEIYWTYKELFHRAADPLIEVYSINLNSLLNKCFLIDQGFIFTKTWTSYEYYPILDVMRVLSSYDELFNIVQDIKYRKLRKQFNEILSYHITCSDLVEIILDYV